MNKKDDKKMTKDFDWEKYLIECLESTEYCCLGTVDAGGVWTNPVYFAYDEKFDLYFISQMHSRHMQNLSKNPKVAVSIYSTEKKDDVFGIQLEGEAKILTEKDNGDEIQKAYEIYYGRAGHGVDIQGYMNNPTWLYVKIVLEHIYYFDTRFFGEERQEVPMKELINE